MFRRRKVLQEQARLLEMLSSKVTAAAEHNADLEEAFGQEVALNSRLLNEHRELRAINTRLTRDLTNLRARLATLGEVAE